jgi:hypothetical protein
MKTILEKLERYVNSYLSFSVEGISLPIALWIIGTHFFKSFDAFPYVVIMSNTKRAGKTRLSEVMSFAARRPMNFSAMTPSTLFRCINPVGPVGYGEPEFIEPTVIFDEAESLSAEGASTMRSVLNSGYRKGQTIPRTVGRDIVEFKVYCPKIFILIGDVYDTLRDRSIVIEMKRGDAPKRFLYDEAKLDGKELADAIEEEKHRIMNKVNEHYKSDRAQFLNDRDEEIWAPLFAICKVIAPDRYRQLQRLAVDLCSLKTADKRSHTTLDMFEEKSQSMEYGERALVDLLAVMNNEKSIFGDEAVKRLRELDLSPWRTFRGKGIEQINLADLLSGFGVPPVNIRIGKTVKRGYRRIDVEQAVTDLKR